MKERRRPVTMRHVAWIVLLSLAAGGCGEPGVTVDPGDAAADLIALDTTAKDAEATDAKGGETSKADGALPDIEEILDTAPACEPGEGCFLEACEGNDDCLSGICVSHMGDTVCSDYCDTDCPQGWRCKQVGTGGSDVAFICVSDFTQLCTPCDDNADCSSLESPTVCVSYGSDGSFCGAACEEDDACPEGFECEERESLEGGSSQQCVPKDGELCGCSQSAMALQLSTPCATENEFGVCTGVRICTQEGLGACSAAQAETEACNGLDDNCDGDVDETTCDDGNACTEDSCLGAEGCSHKPLDGPGCDDADACTVADYCQAGLCAGSALECTDENLCTVDSCDSELGCEFPDFAGGCDDGDDCTFGDLCELGSCLSGAPMACDDGNPCTDDACDPEKGCSHTPNEAACDDSNACTDGDGCADGLCAPTSGVDCNDANPCTTDTCDLATGCAWVTNASPCDDSNPCTTQEVCADGSCGGEGLDCDDSNPCTDDACNNLVGCTHTNNSVACDDSDPCSASDQCSLGTCVGLGALDCDDNNACTNDICEPMAGCSHTGKEGGCDDGDACSVGDACQLGICIGGAAALDCDDKNACTDDVCDPQDGCVISYNQLACDDGNACTQGDTCDDGACAGAVALDCNDGNLCTNDTCDPQLGCQNGPNEAPCDDGSVCTLQDTCQDGGCVSGATMVCHDSNACTDDTCDLALGCQFSPNNAPCDDSNACTNGDACGDGSCQGGAPLNCDDGNGCTTDVCDALDGCVALNNSNGCDDASACTEGDGCADGACVGVVVECDDGNPCTDNDCDDIEGCTTSDNLADCDDGDACTDPDGCQDGGCLGSPVDCDDFNACTDETCDPATGCASTANDDNGCDDNDACTESDACSGGSCVGTAVNCDDGNKCTEDVCDPLDGCQPAAIVPCCGNGVVEDGEECDGGDLCSAQCEESNVTVPNFEGELGPDFSGEGWLQCEGYYDTQNANEIPQDWGNDCAAALYGKIRLVCGATKNAYRYIDVKKNVFKDGLSDYPESDLIVGANFNGYENVIYASGNHPHTATSWWGGGSGCNEDANNITINNSCDWEASNCFGQGLGGPRFLWVYVKP